MRIRLAEPADFVAIWSIFQKVVATGDTFVFAPNTPREEAFDYWFGSGVVSHVVEVEAGRVVAMYRLVANQRDLGSHVGNASYMVDPDYHGQGAGRAMGEHCLRFARQSGYRAMQYNFVVSTNHKAVALWRSLGYATIGTLPKAFLHQQLGYVDVLVLFRSLEDIPVSG